MAVNRANIVDQNFIDTITSFVEGAAQPDLESARSPRVQAHRASSDCPVRDHGVEPTP